MDDSLKSLSLDYLNLLINGQAFSDVTFSVEGRLVHAHRCILAARSLFFRKFFCGSDPPSPGSGLILHDPRSPSGSSASSPRSTGAAPGTVIPVNSVSYEVFLLLLQFLYSGQVSLVPQKHEPRPNCGERGCWHTHCTAAVDLALDTLAAARSFGVEQLVLLTQKQLASMVEKASIEDVMKVLLASRKQDLHQLWTTCSHLVAKSGLPPEVLAKHLPLDVVAKIEELRLKSSLSRHRPSPFLQHTHHQHHPHHLDTTGPSAADLEEQNKIRRMRRALDSSDVELVKLMVMGEGLNLDEALALHYAVENCSREVVKALLELGAADVNYAAGPAGKTPLHIAAEMVCPDMVAVLLDHHADPNVRTIDGVTPLDVLRGLTSDFLFKGAVPGLAHIEPNKLRLCLELVQSAAMVLSREEANNNSGGGPSGNPNRCNPGYSSVPEVNNSSTMDGSVSGLSVSKREREPTGEDTNDKQPKVHKSDFGLTRRKVRTHTTVTSQGESEAGILDDGFTWRKYGQKVILGSRYPRSYYRCVHRHTGGCQATKQVQRSCEDPTIFITACIGIHNHQSNASSTSSNIQDFQDIGDLYCPSEIGNPSEARIVPGTYSAVSAVTELEHSGTKPTRKRLYDTQEEELNELHVAKRDKPTTAPSTKNRKFRAHITVISQSKSEADILDDGFTWCKYGIKDILGSRHPRSYYRCAFQENQNCQALKQVQRSDKDPTIFDVTYEGEHICTQPAAQTDSTLSLGSQLIMPTQNEFDKQVILDFTNPCFPIETHESGHDEQSTITSSSSTSFGGALSSGFGSSGVSDSNYFSAFPNEYGGDFSGVSSFHRSESKLNDEYHGDIDFFLNLFNQ